MEGRRKFFLLTRALTTWPGSLLKYLGQEVKRGVVLLETLMVTC